MLIGVLPVDRGKSLFPLLRAHEISSGISFPGLDPLVKGRFWQTGISSVEKHKDCPGASMELDYTEENRALMIP